MDVSIFLPVYNEIRFIRRTLESIISEADEILISDYGSTDGTSDVLEEFASKYSKIIYANHQGWLYPDRLHWFFQNSHGKYIRLVGGHDMVSSGSTKSMVTVMESDPDAVMVYSKYCICLNQDYTFNAFFCMPEKCFAAFMSDSPLIRVQSTPNHFYLSSIYYGLYKKDVYFDTINFLSSMFADGVITDTGVVAAMLKRGKLICDESSFFFWMKPRKDADAVSEYRRMSKTSSHGITSSPFYWSFATICNCYAVSEDIQTLQGVPDNFNQTSLDIFIKMYAQLFDLLTEKITPADIPPILPKYKSISDKVFHAILDYRKNRVNRMFSTCVKVTRKLAKYMLPYGLVRLIQKIKNKE